MLVWLPRLPIRPRLCGPPRNPGLALSLSPVALVLMKSDWPFDRPSPGDNASGRHQGSHFSRPAAGRPGIREFVDRGLVDSFSVTGPAERACGIGGIGHSSASGLRHFHRNRVRRPVAVFAGCCSAACMTVLMRCRRPPTAPTY